MRGGRSRQPVQERCRQSEASACDCRLLVFDRIVVSKGSAERAQEIKISTQPSSADGSAALHSKRPD